MEPWLDLLLVLLLGVTLYHALRLERALGVLRQDRAALGELVAAFNDSTRQAENGIERLQRASAAAGQALVPQTQAAVSLRDDLRFLLERGEAQADRLEAAVRAAKLCPAPGEAEPGAGAGGAEAREPARLRSRAERDLMKALRLVR
jgi:hypothetical protein